MHKIIDLFKKNIDVIAYIFFGVCTTLVNVATYWVMAYPCGFAVVPSAVIAWFVAVYFAYETNRRWVFHSHAKTLREILRELIAFFTCRFLTGVIDWVMMYICVDVMGMYDVAVKVLANFVVIVLNFVASKFVIFRSK